MGIHDSGVDATRARTHANVTAWSTVSEVLRHRNFARYAAARFLATLSWQMLAVAVGWQTYAVTQDPLALGLVGLVQFLPFLLHLRRLHPRARNQFLYHTPARRSRPRLHDTMIRRLNQAMEERARFRPTL